MIRISYIICAAIWFKDSKKHEHQPVNINTGFVVAGRRHDNIYLTIIDIKDVLIEGYKFLDGEQGFLTNDNRFVDRKEAGEIAFNAGQIDKLTDCLFSEDLY